MSEGKGGRKEEERIVHLPSFLFFFPAVLNSIHTTIGVPPFLLQPAHTWTADDVVEWFVYILLYFSIFIHLLLVFLS